MYNIFIPGGNMDKIEQTDLILAALGWDFDLVLKPKRSNSDQILAADLIYALLEYPTVSIAAKQMGFGEQTLYRTIDKWLKPVFGTLNGGGETWVFRLRMHAGLRMCTSCHTVKPHSDYHKDSMRSDSCTSTCKECRSKSAANWYSHNKEYHQNYLENNRAGFNANNAKRRAAKLQATPSWADLDAIRKIYEECPKGHHVDHIYPLISDWVCGLHVVENLKPIPEKDNMTKGNRYIEEIHG